MLLLLFRTAGEVVDVEVEITQTAPMPTQALTLGEVSRRHAELTTGGVFIAIRQVAPMPRQHLTVTISDDELVLLLIGSL